MAIRRELPKRVKRASSRRLLVESLETRALLSATVQVYENINRTNPWADIQESLAVGSDLYFVSRDPGRSNLELWKTDGTTTGTLRVASLGPNDNKSRQLTNVSGTLYFRGYDAIEGSELWKSNGTIAGTAIVRSLRPGLASSTLTDLINVNGTLFFSGNGELFRSNGSSTGTTRVKDFIAGASDEVSQLAVVGNTLFFSARNPGVQGGLNLYRTNGTSNGTSAIDSVASTTLSEVTGVGSQLFFVRDGIDLWKFDPASSSSSKVYTARTGVRLDNFVDFNGVLYFTENGTPAKSDGTATGTAQLPIREGGEATSLFATDDFLYFSFGEQGSFGSANGQELWRTDGTESGTIQVKNINPRFNEGYAYGSYPNSFVESGGTVFFQAFDGQKTGLWTTDGTEAGTTLVEQSSSSPVDVNGQLFFKRIDGGNIHLQRLPTGQAASTEVKRTGRGTGNSNPSSTTLHNGALYFFADDGVTGNELRRRNSDGSLELVADISPGLADTTNLEMESVNGLLYFSINESTFSSSLWRSDGTSTGTFKLADARVTPNRSDADASLFTSVNSTLFFSAISSAGEELWKTDGTVAGTVMVKDIYPGSTYTTYEGFSINSSRPFELTNLNGTLFFSANNSASGRELWKSDGTTAGTLLVVDHRPGTSNYYPYEVYSSYPFAIRNSNGKLHYMARDETGIRHFESDGTSGGSVAVSPVIAGLNTYRSAKQVGEKVFFVGGGQSGAGQLWKSDGTATGTVMVKDIRTGFYSERISNMTELDGVLYFTADNGIHGNELWKSDGTARGTVMVRDASPGLVNDRPADSNPSEMAAINGILYFSADDGTGTRALWRTNGSENGATRVSGDGTSNPSSLLKLGNRLLFSGDSTLGRELFTLSSAPPVLTLSSGPVVYTEGQQAKEVAPNSVLTDADSSVFRGGRLTVSIGGSVPGDELSLINSPFVQRAGSLILRAGIVFGTISSDSTATSLVINLNQNATVSRTQSLIQAVAFRSTSHNPLARNRNIQFTLTDGESGIMRKNATVQVVPVNDAPTLSGLAGVNYQRNNAGGTAFAANASVADVDSSNFDGGQLRISVAGGDSANNRIYISGNLFSVDSAGILKRGSVIIGTVSAGSGVGTQPFIVQFNASARPSVVTDLLKVLRFGTLNSTSNQLRTISITLSDGDGDTANSSVGVTVAS